MTIRLAIFSIFCAATGSASAADTFPEGLRFTLLYSTELEGSARTTASLFQGEIDVYIDVVDSKVGVTPDSLFDSDNPPEVIIRSDFIADARGVLVAEVFWRVGSETRQSTVRGEESTDPARSLSNKVLGYIINHVSFDSRANLTESVRLHDEAQAALASGDVPRAHTLADDALQAATTNSERFGAKLLLGICERRLGNLGPARTYLEQAQQLNPDDDRPRLELALANLEQHTDESESILMDIRDEGRLSANKARWNLALLYLAQGDLDAAQTEIDAIPPGSEQKLSRGEIITAISRARDRKDLLKKALYAVIGAVIVLLAVIIFRALHRLQRDEALSKKERLEYMFKSMGLLFNVLSMLFGTMLGLFVAS